MKEFLENFKSFIILLVICVILIGWLGTREVQNSETAEIRIDNKVYAVSEICDMTKLGGNIYYDKITGILYYRDQAAYYGGYTPIYKTDGTLKTIEDLK